MMDITQEREAIKNARKIYLAIDGVHATLTKTAASELLFVAQGYVIRDVFKTHIVIEHVDNCRTR